jgi:uncharacterized damage-inducible protein DinB
MYHNEILTLFDYHYWANARVLNAAAKLTQARFIMPASLSHGSIRGTFAHMLAAEMIWRLRCEGTSPVSLLSEMENPTLDELRVRWSEQEQAMRAFLATLDDEALQRNVQYRTTKGVPYENVLWSLLVHVVNHGTQHRAEAAIELTLAGQSPGDLDLILFFRERA